ncbi:MAG: ABC-F family ATP-binding cassette domain-containing protein [Candidatus Shapirobacteria bacterium]
MISVRDLFYSYGKEPIFSGAEFFLGKGQKAGLVGANGAGKSTLFKLITGEENPDDGRVEVSGKIILVPQEVKRDSEMENAKTIRDYLTKSTFAGKATVGKEDYELLRIISKLELAQFSLDSPPTNLSGGQKTKLAIARALVQEPEVLLLDEPTNFLDTEGKKWVMSFLGRYPNTLMVVSHDLNLLDTKIDKILEINSQTKKIDEYTGNYSGYVKLKAEKEELLVRQIHVQERHIVQMKKGWLKMSHVKSSKGIRQKLQLEKRIVKMEESLPQMPPEAKKIKIKLPEPSWVGEMPIMAEGLCKAYGPKKVLVNVSFDIKRGERIALLGPNGAGKSTLIKILMGKLVPDEGEIVRDEKLDIGYYSQEFDTFDFDKTLLETVKDKCSLTEGVIRSQLGRFMFSGEMVFQKVGSLSGGEKTRLSIALLLVQSFNMLILDEPTTYLDVLSQRLILEALKGYQGAMLVVSHTPEFIEELKPNRKFLLPENKMILM